MQTNSDLLMILKVPRDLLLHINSKPNRVLINYASYLRYFHHISEKNDSLFSIKRERRGRAIMVSTLNSQI